MFQIFRLRYLFGKQLSDQTALDDCFGYFKLYFCKCSWCLAPPLAAWAAIVCTRVRAFLIHTTLQDILGVFINTSVFLCEINNVWPVTKWVPRKGNKSTWGSTPHHGDYYYYYSAYKINSGNDLLYDWMFILKVHFLATFPCRVPSIGIAVIVQLQRPLYRLTLSWRSHDHPLLAIMW